MQDMPVAIVTGAGGAVGQATVQELSKDHQVVAIVRNQGSAGDIQELPNTRAFAVDLADGEAVEAAAGLLQKEFPAVRALVHAAAVGPAENLQDCSLKCWQETMAVNVTAPALLTRGLLGSLRAGGAEVVFLNSGAGQRAFADHTAYAASKHALRALADSIRLSEPGLRVTTIFPGQIDSKMLRGINEYLGRPFEPDRYIRPESIAETIRWIVDSPHDVHITNIDVRPRTEIA